MDEMTLLPLNSFTPDFVALSKPELLNVASFGEPQMPFSKTTSFPESHCAF